jgi:hypothetical protein
MGDNPFNRGKTPSNPSLTPTLPLTPLHEEEEEEEEEEEDGHARRVSLPFVITLGAR